MLSRITDSVDIERTLTIGVQKPEGFETATVSANEKTYFGSAPVEDDDEFLFPELEHGTPVRLEGRLTRGNATSNSVGLEYKDHIINCVPETGNIKRYKPALFLTCIVEGTVSRLHKNSVAAEKRPTIIFTNIIPLETDDQIPLFGS